MKKEPLVSIIIPVYNGSNFMKEAIDSALSQTYKNIEIIVINDGSTDNGATEKIAKSYGKKIRYIKKENGGVSTALNLGISKMKGKYFSWLSHDDRYYHDKISTQIEYMNKHKLFDKKVILYSNYDVINEYSEVINRVRFEVYKPNEKPEYALLRGLISGISLLIPKKAFDEIGLFNENYRCIQDYLLFSEFMKEYTYYFTDECTTSTRVHSNQVTVKNPNLIKENDFLWIQMQKNVSDERKIQLEGSLYKFYKEMYNFLIVNNKYEEAQKYAKDKMEECYKIELEKFKKNVFNKSLKEKKEIALNIEDNDFIKNEINILGEREVYKILYKYIPYKINKKENLNKVKKESQTYTLDLISKIKFSIKKDGILKTFKKSKGYITRVLKRKK